MAGSLQGERPQKEQHEPQKGCRNFGMSVFVIMSV
jgi:hypothetical protein